MRLIRILICAAIVASNFAVASPARAEGDKDLSVLEEASRPYVNLLEAASEKIITQGVPYLQPPPIFIPVPLVIANDLSLVGLHLILDGSLIILPGANLSLYGVTLEVHNDPTRRIIKDAYETGTCLPTYPPYPLPLCYGTTQLPTIAASADEFADSFYKFAYVQAWTALHDYLPIPWPPPELPKSYPTAYEIEGLLHQNIPNNKIEVQGELATYDLSEFELPLGLRFEPRRTRLIAQQDPIEMPPEFHFGPFQLVAGPGSLDTPSASEPPSIHLRHTDVENASLILDRADTVFDDVSITATETPLPFLVAAVLGGLNIQKSKFDIHELNSWGWCSGMMGISTYGTDVSLVDSVMIGRGSAAVCEYALYSSLVLTNTFEVHRNSITEWSHGIVVGRSGEPDAEPTRITENTIRVAAPYYGSFGISAYAPEKLHIDRNAITVADGGYYYSYGIVAGTYSGSSVSENTIRLLTSYATGIMFSHYDLNYGYSGFGPPGPSAVVSNRVIGDSATYGQSGLSVGPAYWGNGNVEAPLLISSNQVESLGLYGIGLNVAGLGGSGIPSPEVTDNSVADGGGLGVSIGWGSYEDYLALTYVSLRSNRATNNGVGISISYDARPSISGMMNNWVNGINIDGSEIADQKVYYYDETPSSIAARTADSNEGAGYRGALTCQGLLTFYDIADLDVTDPVLSKNTNGIVAVASSGKIARARVTEHRYSYCGWAAGILSIRSSLRVENSLAANNDTGIAVQSSSPDALPMLVDNDATDNTGAGIQLTSTSPDILRGSSSRNGIGISLDRSSPSVDLTNISDNQTGIFASSSSPRLNGLTIATNGRAMELYGSSPSIDQTSITDNAIGITFQESSPHIRTTTIARNGSFGLSVYGGSPRIEESRIEDNSGYGILVYLGSPTILSSSIRRNGEYGIYVGSVIAASAPKVSGNCIEGHSSYGLVNYDSSHTIDARNNFWRAASGPSGVGPGSGDAVSSFVAFNPWATTCSL